MFPACCSLPLHGHRDWEAQPGCSLHVDLALNLPGPLGAPEDDTGFPAEAPRGPTQGVWFDLSCLKDSLLGICLQNLSLESFHTSSWWKQTKDDILQILM